MAHIAIDARIINSSTGAYIERLLHYLQKVDQTNNYTIILRSKDKNFWKPTSPNFSVAFADFSNYSFGEQFGFKKFLDRLNADLVHFCMPQQPVLYKGLHVTTFHDLTLMKTYNSDKSWLAYHFKQLVGRFVFKSVLKNNAYIITISKFSKQELLGFGHIDPAKVIVTYLAADTSKEKLVPYDHPFDEFIMYVGQQSDYKNIRRLGAAHQMLLKDHPNLGLILVGSINASAKANQAYFKSKGYPNILFTGFLDNQQRDWLYAKTGAYVFPSLFEGFGLPGLEAMGYGAPVVSSNATCLPEIYGDAAVYFNPLDTIVMAEAIEQVISNKKLRQDLVAKGYQQLAKYSWKKTATETLAVYEKALKD